MLPQAMRGEIGMDDAIVIQEKISLGYTSTAVPEDRCRNAVGQRHGMPCMYGTPYRDAEPLSSITQALEQGHGREHADSSSHILCSQISSSSNLPGHASEIRGNFPGQHARQILDQPFVDSMSFLPLTLTSSVIGTNEAYLRFL